MLQKFSAQNFPFRKYLVDVETSIAPPAFLNADEKYDLSVCTADFVRIPTDWSDNLYAKILKVLQLDIQIRQNEATRRLCGKQFIDCEGRDERDCLINTIHDDLNLWIPEPIVCLEKARISNVVRILDETSWPDETAFGMDKSQYAAFKSALTKEISIIQGPPGNLLNFVQRRF